MRRTGLLRRAMLGAGAAVALAMAGGMWATPASAAVTAADPAAIVTEDGLCLDVVGASVSDGTRVQVYPCNGTAAQRWTVRPDGTVRALGRCLTFDEGSATAELHTCAERNSQRWATGGNDVLISSARQGCLTSGASGLVIATCDGRPAQGFAAPVPTGVVTGAGGMCLDVAGAQNVDGTPVQLYTCNGTSAQTWHRYPDGTVRALGKCLDIAGAGTANGTLVQLYSCNGTVAQEWNVHPDGTVLNPHSGRCLDAVDAQTSAGTRVQVWDCFAGANQTWVTPWATSDGTIVAAEWSSGQGRFTGALRLDRVVTDAGELRVRGAVRGTVTGRHGTQITDNAIVDGSTLPPTPDATVRVLSASCAHLELELGTITSRGATGGDSPSSSGSTVTLTPDPEETDSSRRFCRVAEAVSAAMPDDVLAGRVNSVL